MNHRIAHGRWGCAAPDKVPETMTVHQFSQLSTSNVRDCVHLEGIAFQLRILCFDRENSKFPAIQSRLQLILTCLCSNKTLGFQPRLARGRICKYHDHHHIVIIIIIIVVFIFYFITYTISYFARPHPELFFRKRCVAK